MNQRTAKQWQSLIKRQVKEIGTYRKPFDSVIRALAEILEQRDAVYQQFIDEGAELMIVKVSDRGSKNTVRNPLIALWDDLNKTALSYWRDLGLTPKGLKTINEKAMKEKKQSSLAKVLSELGG